MICTLLVSGWNPHESIAQLELIAEINPVVRGWGNYYCKAHVRFLYPRPRGGAAGFDPLEAFIYDVAMSVNRMGLASDPEGRKPAAMVVYGLIHPSIREHGMDV
jgi:hypothetical protein